MSSQKGNTARSRPPKHKNSTKFENDKYDCSKRTKALNNMQFEKSLCTKCEGVIQWKIKYKKYKPLTVPSKCIKCEQKTVKSAYHNICNNCAEELSICAKCGDVWNPEKNEEVNEET